MLTALSSVDPQPQRRQVAVLGVNGDLAAYTGDQCVEAAGHLIGETSVALANMAACPVVGVDGGAVRELRGPLAQRLLNALQAAEEAGGDFRGRRSAAIMVIRANTTGRPWHDMVVDLRVDDSADPVAALADLLVTRARYQDVVRAFQQAIDGDPVTADRELELLRPMDPVTEPDQLMWRAVVAALAGREDAAREMLGELAVSAPQFLEGARRFGKAGLMPVDVIERIVPARCLTRLWECSSSFGSPAGLPPRGTPQRAYSGRGGCSARRRFGARQAHASAASSVRDCSSISSSRHSTAG